MKKKINVLLALIVLISLSSIFLITNMSTNKLIKAETINQKESSPNGVVEFDDENGDNSLKNYILEYLKADKETRKTLKNRVYLKLTDENYVKPDSEDEIFESEMEKIEEMILNPLENENITNLIGLDKAINLKKLVINNNEDFIDDFNNLSNLTKLTYLDLNHTRVFDLGGLENLTNLTYLNLSYSQNLNDLEALKGMTNLKYLNLEGTNVEEDDKDAIKTLTNLTDLRIFNSKIDDLTGLEGLSKLKITSFDHILRIKVKESENKFKLPVLLNQNDPTQELDIVGNSNGLLRKNDDGTYSFTRKVSGIQRVEFKSDKFEKYEFRSGGASGYDIPPYMNVLEIDPDIEDKVTITKTVKDLSNTLLNNEKETKLIPVIKRNGQIINDLSTNNVGHRTSNDELLTYTWNDLPKFDDNYVPYNYEVTIDGSGLPEGYSIEENTKTPENQADYNVNYRYVSPKIDFIQDIPVIGGDKSKIPTEITVTISNDKGLPEKQVPATLKPDKSAYVVNSKEDETNKDKEKITYKAVPKTEIPTYTRSEVDYRYVSPKTTFTATKEWINGPANKPEIKIGLLKNGNSLGDDFVKTVVTENNKTNATVSWENLDKTDENAVDYTYSISEIGEVENYQRTYEGNNKVVNTYVSPKIEVGINVNKNGGKATKAKVKLLKNGVEVPNTLKEITLNTKVTYPNIDKTDTNGNDNHYEIVVAEEVPNYVSVKDNSGNITLTYVSPKVKLTVEKQWIDGENLVPESITAALRRQEGINLVEAYTFELKKSENWTKEVEVDETDFQGDKYEYHLAEKTKVENFKDVVKGLRITNVYRVPKQELTLTKVWTGGKTRKNVTLELKKANGTFVDEKETTKVDENTFKAVFNNVDKTELNGNKINFKADEKETFENYVKSVNGLTVTNTYVSPKIEVSKIVRIEVPKEVFKKTTKEVEVQLYKNGKPVGGTKVIKIDDMDENGKVTVKYPDMDKTDFNGNDHEYNVKLVKEVDGYTSKENKDKNEILIEKNIEKEDKEVVVEYKGGKLRPNVVVELLRDGTVFKTETLTNNEYTFKDVELNDKLGHEYKFELRIKNEKDLKNKHFGVSLESNTNAKKSKITLTYVSPKIDIPVNILWQGKGRRNPTVKIQLLKNGVPTGEIVELTGKDDYIFKGMDKTDSNGNEYDYKVSVVGDIKEFYYEITPNGRTIIATREDLKGKTLPYAGLKENMTMSYVVLAVLIAGFVYSNKAKRNMNKLENISDIRRNNLRKK